MKKILQTATLCFFYCFSFSVQATDTFVVQVLNNGKLTQTGVGTLIAEGYIIASENLVSQGNQILIKDPTSNTTLVGQEVGKDENLQLSLILVSGIQGTPIQFGILSTEIGKNIKIVKSDRSTINGVIRTILPSNDQYPFEHIQHTIAIDDNQFGAPLLNNCDQIVGLSVHKQRGIFDKRLSTDKSFGYALTLTSITNFIEQNKLAVNRADTECLSEKAQLELLAKTNKEQAELGSKIQQEKEAAAKELKRLQEETADKENALKKAAEENRQNQAEREAIEAEIKQLELAKIEQQKALEQAEKEQLEQQRALQKAQQEAEAERIAQLEKLKAVEDAKQKEEEKTILYLAIAGGIILLIIIIVLIILSKRRRQLASAQAEIIANINQLNNEQAKVASAQEELDSALATFNDIVFVGTDAEGIEHRVKVIGNTLARAKEGVTIGRSAQEVDYLLNAQCVSRIHARVTLENNEVFIQDLNSSNGTAVNGEALQNDARVAIKTGNSLRLGTISGQIIIVENQE